MFGNNKSPFGSTPPNTPFGFGSDSTAHTNPFRQSQPFGGPAAGTFGSPSNSTFGRPVTGIFGNPSSSNFGRPATSATGTFGSPFSSTFGRPANTSWFTPTQAQPTNVFQNANTTFGATTCSSGGFGSSNPFGQQRSSTNSPFNTSSTLEQQNKPHGFSFGTRYTQRSPFGQQQSKTFQHSNDPFTTGTVIKFNSVMGTDIAADDTGMLVNIKTEHHSITCMKEYENKSFEELRFEDYLANRKGPSKPFGQQPPSASGLFNTTFTSGPPTKPPGFFFSAQPSPFGQQARRRLPRIFPSTAGSLFGGTTGFGGQQSTGTVVKFNPVISTDIKLCNGVEQTIYTKCYSITCMKEYEDKSFEELRFEDYFANRKGPSNSFGQQQHSTSSLFNTSSTFGRENKPSGFNFGTQSTHPSLFGQQSQQQQSSIFQPFTNNHFGNNTSFGGQQSAGPIFNLDPVPTTETNDKLQSITCQKEYEDKSFEELRFENYLANGKCSQAGFGAASFGTVATCTPSPFGQGASRSSFGAAMEGFKTRTSFSEKTFENKSDGTTTTTTYGMMMFVTKSTTSTN